MDALNCSDHPRTVFVEILYGCNLYCTYCYVGQKQNHVKPFIPALDVTLDLLKMLRAEKVEEVVLLGGEPMLHPGFADICHAIAELNFPYRGVVTNGTVMTREKALLLQQTGFWVDISFRGPDSNIFDSITGKVGSFWKAFDAALLLSKMGIPVGIEFDCIPQNYDKLYETIAMLVSDGVLVKQLQLHRILPAGDAKHSINDFFLNLDQWQTVFSQASRIRDELHIPVAFEDGFPLCLVRPEHRDMITPCACGFTLLTIAPNGDARYCSCHEEILGNIRREPLAAIWRSSLKKYRTSNRYPVICLQCDLFEACRGGCSASIHTKMNEGIDIFHEHFQPIKVTVGEGERRPGAKLIMGQRILSS